ncbi:MAG: acyl-CoA dehydrogenase [Acidobacteria bacterium]|nr:acyl-CoA dehydrogenase [Acidobacteriota bacterium]MBI3658160.1 acyl-CoA dehydrogenase [Acidobacteriota bacterium]
MGDHRFTVDKRDMAFVLFEQIDLERQLLVWDRYRELTPDLLNQVIDHATEFAAKTLAPLNSVGDVQGCRFEDGRVFAPAGFKQAFRQYCDNEWLGLADDPQHGGSGLPLPMAVATSEIFMGANLAFMMYPGLTHGAARLIVTFGEDWMRRQFVPKLMRGEWTGTMCLTEPQVGSYVGDTQTSAIRRDGQYLLKGVKIFISAGEHDLADNIIHLVLARTEGAPAGIKGISLFLVPKFLVTPQGDVGERNDLVCSGIEHKMGINGSATCTINFGDNDHCVGYLVGKECQGIEIMFQLMNEARIAVGIQGLALGAAAYQTALSYAKERVQGVSIAQWKDPLAERVPIIAHPDVRRMLATMKAYVEGLRALLYHVSFYHEMATYLPEAAAREKYQDMVDVLTPICKAYCTDTGFDATRLALQVHGGYGYIREYQVEQFMRDMKIGSIYEGTNGIQALDLIGRKLPQKKGRLFMQLANHLNEFAENYRSHNTVGLLVEAWTKAKDSLVEVTMHIAQLGLAGNWVYPALSATPYLMLMGDVVLGYYLIDQARVASDRQTQGSAKDQAFYQGKIKTAEFFIYNILPAVAARASAIKSGDMSAMEIEF